MTTSGWGWLTVAAVGEVSEVGAPVQDTGGGMSELDDEGRACGTQGEDGFGAGKHGSRPPWSLQQSYLTP